MFIDSNNNTEMKADKIPVQRFSFSCIYISYLFRQNLHLILRTGCNRIFKSALFPILYKCDTNIILKSTNSIDFIDYLKKNIYTNSIARTFVIGIIIPEVYFPTNPRSRKRNDGLLVTNILIVKRKTFKSTYCDSFYH